MTKRDLIQDTSEMNVIFIHSLVDDARLSPFTLKVYAHLARRAGNGAAWPSVEGMAEHCGMAVNTVKKAINDLLDRGMLAKQERPGRTNLYFLTKPSQWTPRDTCGHLPTLEDTAPPPTNDPPHAVTPHPPQQMTPHPPHAMGGEGNPRRTSKEGDQNMIGAEAPKVGVRKQIRDRTADELALARLIQPDMLASDVFKAAWTAWQGYREERATRPLSGESRTPWTERAAGAALKNFLHIAQRFGDDALRRMVDRSIDRRWLEVFEPKGSDTIKTSTSTMTEEQLKGF